MPRAEKGLCSVSAHSSTQRGLMGLPLSEVRDVSGPPVSAARPRASAAKVRDHFLYLRHAPPVIERIADHAEWAGLYLLQPARLGEDVSSGRVAWGPTSAPRRQVLEAPRGAILPFRSAASRAAPEPSSREARATLCVRRLSNWRRPLGGGHKSSTPREPSSAAQVRAARRRDRDRSETTVRLRRTTGGHVRDRPNRDA